MLSSRGFLATRYVSAAAVSTASKATNSKRSDVGVKKKSSVTTFNKQLPVSPSMQTFLGVPEVSRTEAVKKIWEYIKKHDLQNPEDKRMIMCDEKLKSIFAGKDKVGMLEIGKLLASHFVKTTD